MSQKSKHKISSPSELREMQTMQQNCMYIIKSEKHFESLTIQEFENQFRIPW